MINKDYDNYWKSYSIKYLSDFADEWSYCEIIDTIPDDHKNAELGKFYLWNTSNSTIFIDDIKVEFFE